MQKQHSGAGNGDPKAKRTNFQGSNPTAGSAAAVTAALDAEAKAEDQRRAAENRRLEKERSSRQSVSRGGGCGCGW